MSRRTIGKDIAGTNDKFVRGNVMTFVEAAIEILRQNNNDPLSPIEIWDRMCKLQLVHTNGKTPWATLDTHLRMHQRNSTCTNKGKVLFDPSKEL